MCNTDNEAPWLNINIPAPLRSQTRPPTIMWVNWPEKIIPNPDGVGGFFSADRHGGVPLIGGCDAAYAGRESNADPGVFATTITAAILAYRSAWGNWTGRRWTPCAHDSDGARKRVDVLMLVKTEDGSQIAKMTLVGTVNDAIVEAMDRFQRDTKSVQAEPWMFWIRLSSGGKPITVGAHRSRMTPMDVILPEKEELATAYIGDDLVTQIVEMASYIDAWRGAYQQTSLVGEESYAEALKVRVRTKSMGSVTFGEMIAQDSEYAHQVITYIHGHADQFTPDQVRAVRVLTATFDDEDPDDDGGVPL